VGLGLASAVVLILATPGLAITAIVALLVLVVCGLSYLLERSLTRPLDVRPRHPGRAAEVARRRRDGPGNAVGRPRPAADESGQQSMSRAGYRIVA